MNSRKVKNSKAPSVTIKEVKKLEPIGKCSLLPYGTKIIFDEPRSTIRMPLLESHSSDLPPTSPKLIIDGVHAMPKVSKLEIPDIQANIEGLCETNVLVPQYHRAGFHRYYRSCLRFKTTEDSNLRLDIYSEPLAPRTAPFTLSFNPSVMTDREWCTFEDLMFQIFNGEAHKYFKKGYYRSIDVAVDFPDVKISDLRAAATNYTDSYIYNKSGKVNAIYFGSRKSRSRIKTYDKKLQLKQKKKKSLSYELTRFEFTYKGHIALNNPNDVPNLFKRLTVSHTPIPKGTRAADLNFLDAVQMHGAERVIRRYGCPKTRSQKRRLLEVVSTTAFDFGAIWEQQWPKVSNELYQKLTKK